MLETLQVFESPLQPLSPPLAQVQLAASAAGSAVCFGFNGISFTRVNCN